MSHAPRHCPSPFIRGPAQRTAMRPGKPAPCPSAVAQRCEGAAAGPPGMASAAAETGPGARGRHVAMVSFSRWVDALAGFIFHFRGELMVVESGRVALPDVRCDSSVQGFL